jgi:hypothetical protein
MGPERSLPYSKEPAMGPYLQPGASSQHLSTLLYFTPSTKILYTFLISPVRATCPNLNPLDLIIKRIFSE